MEVKVKPETFHHCMWYCCPVIWVLLVKQIGLTHGRVQLVLHCLSVVLHDWEVVWN